MLASPSTSSYFTLWPRAVSAGCSLMSANDTLAHPIRTRIDLEVAGAGQSIAAVEPTLIQAHPAARHEVRRMAVLDGERQVGGDPVPILVGQG